MSAHSELCLPEIRSMDYVYSVQAGAPVHGSWPENIMLFKSEYVVVDSRN